MRLTLLAGLFALVFLAADEPKTAEVDRHQGTWTATSFVYDGKETPKDVVESITRVVEGDHVVWKREGKNFAGTKVELDPTKEPKTIDVVPDGGPNRDQRVFGIYKLEGDKLTICMAALKGERPKTFDAEKGSGQTLMKFEKLAPK